MHVLETLRGQPPLHGTYMFLSLFAGLGVGHFMTGLWLLYWEQAFGVWALLHSQGGTPYFSVISSPTFLFFGCVGARLTFICLSCRSQFGVIKLSPLGFVSLSLCLQTHLD